MLVAQQGVEYKKFQKFDYGSAAANQAKYGQVSVPPQLLMESLPHTSLHFVYLVPYIYVCVCQSRERGWRRDLNTCMVVCVYINK